jgi:hypothetical protein
MSLLRRAAVNTVSNRELPTTAVFKLLSLLFPKVASDIKTAYTLEASTNLLLSCVYTADTHQTRTSIITSAEPYEVIFLTKFKYFTMADDEVRTDKAL